MEKQSSIAVVLEERFKDNLRIRICQYGTTGGSTEYGVDVSAWEDGQGKFLGVVGGIPLERAQFLARSIEQDFRRYDWDEERMVAENEK